MFERRFTNYKKNYPCFCLKYLMCLSVSLSKLLFSGQSHLPLPLGEVPPQGAERALSVTAKAVTA